MGRTIMSVVVRTRINPACAYRSSRGVAYDYVRLELSSVGKEVEES